MKKIAKLLNSFRNNSLKPQHFFLLFFVPIALLLSVILPPFMGPDEASHTYRAQQFSRGEIFMDRGVAGYGANIDAATVKLNQSSFWENARQPFFKAINFNLHSQELGSGQVEFQYFENTAVYSPLGYLHFIVTTLVSRILDLNSYVSFLLLRWANIAAYATLVYFAISVMPKRKWFIAMAGLLPMAVHQATVVSPDGLINGSALLAVALIAKLIFDKRATNAKTLILIGSLLFITSFSKQAYIFLPLILLLVPEQVFPKAFGKLRYFGTVFSVTVIALLAWNLMPGQNSSAAFDAWRVRDNFGQTASTGSFVKKLASEPVTSALFVTHSLVYNIAPIEVSNETHPEYYAHNQWANFTFTSFLGAFGSLMIGYPTWVYVIVVIGLLLPLLAESERHALLKDRRQRRLVWGVILLVSATLTFTLWLKWTAVTDPAIVGLQGRYFIPLLGLLAFLPVGKILVINIKKNSLIPILASIVLLEFLLMFIVIFDRFYSGWL